MPIELVFSGKNRKQELRRLKRAFDVVTAAAQARNDSVNVKEPSHRIILIEAERGLGKTRLVQELYRYACAFSDNPGYWPGDYREALRDSHVMPRAEECDYRQPIPFLWWGLSVAPDASVGSTVLGSLPDLLPHLVTARIASQRRESNAELVDEATRLAVDLGLPVAEAALEFTGIGTLKRLGEAGFRIGRVVTRQRQEAPHAIIKGRQQRETLVDTVLADLQTLFSRSSRNFAGIPLVMVVDDAQFADSDREVAALVEKLVAKSAQESWPLLLIITHWARQLGPWVDGDGRRHPPSRIARVMRPSRFGETSEPGPLTNVGGLPEPTLTRIDLSEPVDGLADALREVFPGLSDKDLNAIASKAGGNPRKLEQISARLMRNPRWFENRNSNEGFSDHGRAIVMALADLPIDEIALAQFADTTPEVRRAVMIASLMGNRFVCDLVERLAVAHGMDTVRNALEDGERRYRLLRDVVDRSKNDIASFCEQLFFDAAKEYRESGMANQEIPNWPEDEALLGALDELLAELVHDPDQFLALGLDDWAEALNLASIRMKQKNQEDAGLAFARLVEIETRRGNPEGAYYAAAQFMEGFDP